MHSLEEVPFEHIDTVCAVVKSLVLCITQIYHWTGGVNRCGQGGWGRG